MFRKNKIPVTLVVFYRWSRKGYAVFASLGKVIKIAPQKVDICKQLLKNNYNLLTATTLFNGKKIKVPLRSSVQFTISELLFINVLLTERVSTKEIPEGKKLNKLYNQGPCFAIAFHGLFFISHDECNKN